MKKSIPFKPLDFVILALVIAAAVFAFWCARAKKNSRILVQANGRQFVYSLEKDGVYEVEGLLGKTVFEIKNRRVHIIDSACPNKTCVSMGYRDLLVCLPNGVIIQTEGEATGAGSATDGRAVSAVSAENAGDFEGELDAVSE